MEENMNEIWRDIIGYEDLYQVSNLGRVRSVDRVVEHSNGNKCYYKGRVLKAGCDKGYYQIRLYKEGKGKTKKIHQLVSMAFLDHIPNGHKLVVDHIDGNKINNRVDNLQLISQRENSSKDRSGHASKHIGVSWHKKASKWVVRIVIGNKYIYLGLFIDEKEASQMYKLALSNIDKYNGSAKEFREYLNSL